MCFRDFVPLVVPCSSVFSLPLDSILHLLFWSPSPTFYHLLKSICVFFLELIVVSKSLLFSIYFPCSSQVVNAFSSCIPFSAESRGKVSLFLIVTSWPFFNRYSSSDSYTFKLYHPLPGIFPSFLEHLLAPSFTVTFISVIILGSWWFQGPCRAPLLKMSSGLWTVCYQCELL